jgi:hypothetical protein
MSFDDLPEGPLCYSDLVWKEKKHSGTMVLAATIPEGRLDDFMKGEGLQHGVSFSKRNSHQKSVKVSSCTSSSWYVGSQSKGIQADIKHVVVAA